MYTLSRCQGREAKITRITSATGGTPLQIAIIGAGSIGTAWAIVFATAGHAVRIHDIEASRRVDSRDELNRRLADLAEAGLLSENIERIAERVSYYDSLDAVIAGASYVQECIIEDREAKRQLFTALAPLLGAETIVASSSSFITTSRMAADCAFRNRCLVVHPGNPPYLLRVVEIVPAPFTDAVVIEFTTDLMTAMAMNPVLVRRELEGFVFNRLQGALLREAYALVHDGAASVDDIDRLVRDGLGLRWSVVGPFEAADLNTRGGIAAHAQRMLPSYRRMGAERGEAEPAWVPETVETVIAERRKALPLENWADRAAWRDHELMALLAHRAKRNDGAT